MTLFATEFEEQAIERIIKFSQISKSMGLEVAVGFSGGKDSQVTYDLCVRAGIEFTAYYNVSFENNITKQFIKSKYPQVVWRKEHNFGFIENIIKNHGGLLPTVQIAYCCQDYKHNPKYVDKCSVVGVRRAESRSRSNRTTFSAKNKTILKNSKTTIDAYFKENCQSIGTKSIIQLLPIVDWSDKEVWDYIYKDQMPINPDYNKHNRIGCIVCPKISFRANSVALIDAPLLIDAFIRAKEKGTKNKGDWIITSEGKDYTNDKVYYICRWLNHSFMPFSKAQEKLYKQVRDVYDAKKKSKNKQLKG